MATYVEVKIIFDFLSKIEISRFFDFQNLIFNRTINRGPCCYNWCWKQHSIIVAHFQQKCCFLATNVDFSRFCTFIQVKIEIWMKKQQLLPKNNNFVVINNNDIMLPCTIFIASGPSENLAYALLNFLTRVFCRFLGDLLKKMKNEFL